MDPVAGAQNIIVVMTHASKNGESKLLPQCTLPLTGVGCIRRVLTDPPCWTLSTGRLSCAKWLRGQPRRGDA